MQGQTTQPLRELIERFSAFLPTLTAGLLVLAVGVALGWVLKRAIVRLLIWLRLDRLAGRVGWRAAFGKGDVRGALYEMLGNAGMLVVVLLFLDDTLKRWGLTALARVIESIVFYLPNLGLVALIVAAGVFIANGLSARVAEGLEEEGFAHARLFAKSLKGALLALVAALGLWQLEFARQVVLAAFLIAFGSVGVAFALAVGIGSARAIERGWEIVFQKKEKDA
ncbi:MAG: mechanosensitive ion channel family protein [Gemmatimonadales bacterium]